MGLGFLVLELPRGVAQIYGIAWFKAWILKLNWQIYKFQVVFQKSIYIVNPSPVLIFSGIAKYSWEEAESS